MKKLRKVYKTICGNDYLLKWTNNPALWNEKLSDLQSEKLVVKIGRYYYSTVQAHSTGIFNIVDCTCDNKGNFYPINVSNLRVYE